MPKIENKGSLMTWEGTDECLGYLMTFKGRGTYEPNVGRVDVTPKEAEAHNKALDDAMLKGMDESCEVGQGGSFYVSEKDGRVTVKTFLGVLVSDDTTRKGSVLTFRRAGKVYRGRLSKEYDLFNFRRVS